MFAGKKQALSLHNRGQERAHIGTVSCGIRILIHASIAKGYGLYAEGPISDPNDLVPALQRGIERVKKGEPVLLDVVTQPR